MAKKILIVEDSADLGLLWKRLFRKSQYHADICVDGRSALASLEEMAPDLLLTDFFLPDVNGIELIEAARKVFPHLPVILVTGNQDYEIVNKIKRLENATFLLKPVKFRDVVEAADQLVSQGLGLAK